MIGAITRRDKSSQAARQATRREYLALSAEAWRDGKPTFFHLLLFLGIGLFPRRICHWSRRLLQTRR
jgi:hypothetical protein